MLAYFHGEPVATGDFKTQNEDFRVTEFLNFQPSGEGEHLLLEVEKVATNTHYVAKQLAMYFNLPSKHVSYAGLKDRHSVSRQWFGIWIPGQPTPSLENWHVEQVKLLQAIRHNKKLRLGAIARNQFDIVLRNVTQLDTLESRLYKIKKYGVANYFGEQRFGRYEDNVERAKQMFAGKRVKDRKQRSLYLSAARSHLFNLCVSARIDNQMARQIIDGDVLKLRGSNSVFVAEQLEQVLLERLEQGDVELTAPLVGAGELASKQTALQLEQNQLKDYANLVSGLAKAGLKQQRRAIKLLPENMNWSIDKDNLNLSFELPSGAFATAVLRELLKYRDMS